MTIEVCIAVLWMIVGLYQRHPDLVFLSDIAEWARTCTNLL
ncbi:hypothetical protein LCGC14_1592190 [marine sediment metagenome]|uniref:Uncharacterized protein n=1 Tax=marine sediment metagenome TaxID=412755 RepID=A0A0F9IZZ9_9ZZZZ